MTPGGRFTPETASAAGRRGAAERERRFLSRYRLPRDREREQMRQVRWATAILTRFLGPPSRPRRLLSWEQAELARILVLKAGLVLVHIVHGREERPRDRAALAYMRFLYPLPPLPLPLGGSRGYRIRRLGWMAEGDQVREWLRAIEREDSILRERPGDPVPHRTPLSQAIGRDPDGRRRWCPFGPLPVSDQREQ